MELQGWIQGWSTDPASDKWSLDLFSSEDCGKSDRDKSIRHKCTFPGNSSGRRDCVTLQDGQHFGSFLITANR
jgi:hypothetical protein